MPIDDDRRGVKFGLVATMDAENFVFIFVLALVVDPGLPRAVSGAEIWFTVAVADGENFLSSLCSESGTGSFESQHRPRCATG